MERPTLNSDFPSGDERRAIFQLFENGHLDEDAATVRLLAIAMRQRQQRLSAEHHTTAEVELQDHQGLDDRSL